MSELNIFRFFEELRTRKTLVSEHRSAQILIPPSYPTLRTKSSRRYASVSRFIPRIRPVRLFASLRQLIIRLL